MASPKTLRIKDQKRFRKLCAFLRRHRNWPERYHAASASRVCHGTRSAREKLAALFRSALESNSGGGLSMNAAAMREFCRKIGPLGNKKRITAAEFLSCFGSSSGARLFDDLIKINGVNRKKAALFLRDLRVTGSFHPDAQIFDRLFPDSRQLRIPLDVVIAVVLNQVVRGTPFKKGMNLAHSFDRVNEFADARLGNDRMLLEDLWFWGFFGLSGTGYDRRAEVNQDKLAMAPFFRFRDMPLAQFERFGLLVFAESD